MQRITVVLEYEDFMQIPVFGANMYAVIAGTSGKIVAVAFEDALSEKDDGDSI